MRASYIKNENSSITGCIWNLNKHGNSINLKRKGMKMIKTTNAKKENQGKTMRVSKTTASLSKSLVMKSNKFFPDLGKKVMPITKKVTRFLHLSTM